MAVCVVVVDAPECPLFATVAAINSYSNHSVAAHFDRESLEETHTVMETRLEEVSGPRKSTSLHSRCIGSLAHSLRSVAVNWTEKKAPLGQQLGLIDILIGD